MSHNYDLRAYLRIIPQQIPSINTVIFFANKKPHQRLGRALSRKQKEIKTELRLSDRTFHCSCDLEIDRDLNAALNLNNYGVDTLQPT